MHTSEQHYIPAWSNQKYDNVNYTQGLKMEGSTLVQFTTKAPATVVIVQSTWSDHTLKFDNQELTLASASAPDGSEGVRIYTLKGIAAGTHKITRGSGESGIFYVEVREAGTTAIQAIRARVPSNATYNLSGQRVDATYKGIVIRNGRQFIQY